MGQLELAGPLLPRLVGPHEFQRHPLAGQRLAVEDDRGPGGPFAAKVDGLRQLGLAHLLLPRSRTGPCPWQPGGRGAAVCAWRSIPHQGGEFGHRLAQPMNGAQPVGGVEQGDKADPVRARAVA